MLTLDPFIIPEASFERLKESSGIIMNIHFVYNVYTQTSCKQYFLKYMWSILINDRTGQIRYELKVQRKSKQKNNEKNLKWIQVKKWKIN